MAASLIAAPVSASAGYGHGGAGRGSSGPLVFGPLMKGLVDPVAQGVGGLVGECFVEIAEDDAHQEVRLPWSGSEAGDRGCGQLLVGGGGKYPDLLDAVRVGAEGIADAVAEGFLVIVLGDGDGQVPGDRGHRRGVAVWGQVVHLAGDPGIR